MNDLYREEILAHWQNPQNFGVMENPDLIVEQVNPLCGDEITIYIKFDPHTSEASAVSSAESVGSDSSEVEDLQITDIRFTGAGCAISIASASLLSENIKGKSVGKLSKITGQDVLKMLGGNIAPARLKCAFLALEAIKKLKI